MAMISAQWGIFLAILVLADAQRLAYPIPADVLSSPRPPVSSGGYSLLDGAGASSSSPATGSQNSYPVSFGDGATQQGQRVPTYRNGNSYTVDNAGGFTGASTDPNTNTETSVCVDALTNRVYQLGDTWDATDGGCRQLSCQRYGAVSECMCGEVFAPSGCEVVRPTPTGSYPSCCPWVWCPSGAPPVSYFLSRFQPGSSQNQGPNNNDQDLSRRYANLEKSPNDRLAQTSSAPGIQGATASQSVYHDRNEPKRTTWYDQGSDPDLVHSERNPSHTSQNTRSQEISPQYPSRTNADPYSPKDLIPDSIARQFPQLDMFKPLDPRELLSKLNSGLNLAKPQSPLAVFSKVIELLHPGDPVDPLQTLSLLLPSHLDPTVPVDFNSLMGHLVPGYGPGSPIAPHDILSKLSAVPQNSHARSGLLNPQQNLGHHGQFPSVPDYSHHKDDPTSSNPIVPSNNILSQFAKLNPFLPVDPKTLLKQFNPKLDFTKPESPLSIFDKMIALFFPGQTINPMEILSRILPPNVDPLKPIDLSELIGHFVPGYKPGNPILPADMLGKLSGLLDPSSMFQFPGLPRIPGMFPSATPDTSAFTDPLSGVSAFMKSVFPFPTNAPSQSTHLSNAAQMTNMQTSDHLHYNTHHHPLQDELVEKEISVLERVGDKIDRKVETLKNGYGETGDRYINPGTTPQHLPLAVPGQYQQYQQHQHQQYHSPAGL